MTQPPSPLTMLLSRHTRRRHALLALLLGGAAAVTWPHGGYGQQPPIPTVGVLRVNRRNVGEAFVDAFRRDMRELGWEDGRNVRFLVRWAELENERLPGLARELVAAPSDIIIAFGDAGIRAARQASPVIPIIGLADDMVASGFAASMARPGGPTTGVSLLTADLDAKRLELLHEFVPAARRVGVLGDPLIVASRPHVEAAARRLGLDLVPVNAGSRDEIARALDALEAARVEAVNVLASPLLYNGRALILERLRRARLPAIYQFPEAAEEGGFLAYGPRLVQVYRQLAVLANKVLRGAHPADLPVEQPARFELVVNLAAAQALGVAIPPALLDRANKVIE